MKLMQYEKKVGKVFKKKYLKLKSQYYVEYKTRYNERKESKLKIKKSALKRTYQVLGHIEQRTPHDAILC